MKAECVVYPATPKKVSEINANYIRAYLDSERKAGRITREQVKELHEKYSEIHQKTNGKPWTAWRSEFVHRFFPELRKSKKTNKKLTWDAYFENLLGEE